MNFIITSLIPKLLPDVLVAGVTYKAHRVCDIMWLIVVVPWFFIPEQGYILLLFEHGHILVAKCPYQFWLHDAMFHAKLSFSNNCSFLMWTRIHCCVSSVATVQLVALVGLVPVSTVQCLPGYTWWSHNELKSWNHVLFFLKMYGDSLLDGFWFKGGSNYRWSTAFGYYLEDYSLCIVDQEIFMLKIILIKRFSWFHLICAIF